MPAETKTRVLRFGRNPGFKTPSLTADQLQRVEQAFNHLLEFSQGYSDPNKLGPDALAIALARQVEQTNDLSDPERQELIRKLKTHISQK